MDVPLSLPQFSNTLDLERLIEDLSEKQAQPSDELCLKRLALFQWVI